MPKVLIEEGDPAWVIRWTTTQRLTLWHLWDLVEEVKDFKSANGKDLKSGIGTRLGQGQIQVILPNLGELYGTQPSRIESECKTKKN